MPPPPSAPPLTGQTYIRRVQFLALTIWLLFVAYAGGQLLQSSINADVGFACLVEVYLVFGMCALIAPWIVASFDIRWLIALASSFYVLFTSANIDPLPAPLLISCAAVGLSAPVLWSAQSLYVAKAAAAYSEVTGLSNSQANSLLNTAFYTIFTSSGGTSAAMVTITIYALDTEDTHALFVLLTAIGALGVLLMLFLAPPGDKEAGVLRVPRFLRPLFGGSKGSAAAEAEAAHAQGAVGSSEKDSVELIASSVVANTATVESVTEAGAAPSPPAATPAPAPPKPPSLMFMLRFLVSEKRMLYAAPIIFEVGFMSGVFNGAFVGQIVKPSISASLGSGLAAVGVVGAVQSFASAIATRLWSPYLQRPDFGRRWAFVYGIGCHAIFFAFLTLWSYYYRDGTSWPSSSVSLPLYIAFVLIWSVGDSVMWSQLPAVLQTYYPQAPHTPCAMSGLRLFSALGTASSFAISVTVANASSPSSSLLWTQCAGGLVLLALAAYSLHYLHHRIESIDGPVNKANAASINSNTNKDTTNDNNTETTKGDIWLMPADQHFYDPMQGRAATANSKLVAAVA